MKTITVRTNIVTKTTLDSDHSNLKWSSGDKVSLFNNVNTTNTSLTYSADGDIVVDVPAATSEIYMHYPYFADNTSGPKTVSVYIAASQTQKDPGVLNGYYYPMVAKGTVSSDNKALVKFYPVAGALALNIYHSGLSGTETVQSVTVTPDAANTGFIGRQITDLTGDNIKYSSTEATAKSVTVTLTNGLALSNTAPANKKTFNGQIYVCLAKQSYKNVKFEIKTDKGVYTITSNSTPFDLVNKDFIPVNIDLAKASADKIIYSTEFNYPMSGSSYQEAGPISGSDATGTSWFITYGNWNGGNCAQLRVYAAGNFGVIYNGFDCSNVTKVSYDAKSNNENLKLNTYYSTDKGSTWVKVDDKKSLTTSYANYSFVVSSTGEYPRVRIKFEADGTAPSSGNNQLTIDNVVIYGDGSVLPDPSITADNITDVSGAGVTDATATYTIHNFTGADDITVTCDGIVTAASVDHAGKITYTVAPNYTSSSKNGTITLSSPREGVDKTITVTQNKSTLTVSTTTITIPKDATSATFTITSAEFDWNASIVVSEGKNLAATPTSHGASDEAQTVTVASNTLSSSSEQILGTITVYRNGNTSDPQKKTITIKKASSVEAATYTKVTSITSGAKYLVCETNANKVVSSWYSSGSNLSVTDVTITGGTTITGNSDIDGYTFIITALTGADSGYYSIYFEKESKYVGYNTSTKFSLAENVSSDSYKWTISIDASGVATIENKSATARYWGYNGSTDFRPYSNSSGYNNKRPVLFKKN